ncbi:MAG: metallophosphoesterase [Planctomycetota bacterium]
MRILHVSDIHFGAHEDELVDALCDSIEELAPDLVIASGDFTSAGRPREFLQARALIESLSAPVLATPGNHDIPAYALFERFFRPLRRYRRTIEPVTMDRSVEETHAILSLNTARAWDLSLDWSHGYVSRAQVEDASSFFRAHADAPFKALVVHHPFIVPDWIPGFRAIRNGEAMLRVLAEHRVDAVFAGHLHQRFSVTYGEDVAAPDHSVTVLQVGTATSHRRRDQPNGFALVEIQGGSHEVIAHEYRGGSFVRTDAVPHANAGISDPYRSA